MKTTFIYALCEPGTRTVRYIGKTNTPSRRLRDHLSTSIKMKTYLGNWLRLLVSKGEKPDLIILREVPYEQWEIAEERYIRMARGCGMKLVNLTDGGDGVTQTPEVRRKISVALTGPLNYAFGKKRPPETCAKIGAGQTGTLNHMFGKKHAPGACAKIIGPLNPAFGTKRSLETRARMSAAQSGAGNPMFGKKQSPETIAKRVAARVLSRSLKGA